MLHIKVVNGKADGLTEQWSQGTENRNDWRTFAQAEQRAAELSRALRRTFIATDAGEHVSPRYDIVEVPGVGEKVSYAFNGDCYPCGTVTAVSKSFRVIRTSEGRTFYRRRQTGAWVNGRTWSLVAGHHYSQNPHV